MTTKTEFELLDQIHMAINLDQSVWQVDQLASGDLGLVRRHQVDDYVWCEATVEVDDVAARQFTVRGLVVSCYDPVRQRVLSCTSIHEASAAAGDMLRWAFRAANEVAAENYRQA